MRIALRSALIMSGGLGLAYVLLPQVRDRIRPAVRSASRAAGKVADGYNSVKAQRLDTADFRPAEGIEDVKALVRSFSRRLSDLEKAVRPGGDGRTNEYQEGFMH